jgi:hypothetical protein
MIQNVALESIRQLPLRCLADFAYTRPFLQPLPIWNYWYLLILPLCLAVAVVYKSIKCRSMSQVPRQAATITIWILLSFAAAAAALAGIVGLVQKMQ